MANYPDFEERCGYGDILGICGVNCRHNFHPFIPGVMERTYTDEQLNNIDKPPFEYEGKTYTTYEATQKQRQIETSIRHWKRRAAAATNDEDKQAAQIRIRRLNEKYKEFSEAAGLRMQKERMNIASVKPSLESRCNTGKIVSFWRNLQTIAQMSPQSRQLFS
ncbi:MAG: hypothetical protein IJ221_06990 [Oscillibacter sp.]|nr:hypothetical protein [Oscillibacter sp.]